jgi:uncharacterized membrane protein
MAATTRFVNHALLCASLLALASCSSPNGSSPATCPNDLPKGCPSPAPTYADVAPILAKRCASCHAPNGQEKGLPLTTYADVKAEQGDVLDQLYECRMPPATAQPPTTSEREQLLQWLVCDAPE